MNAEPIKLRFVHRFQNGTLCTLTFQLIDGVPRPHHLWSGPLPKFKGEPPRLAETVCRPCGKPISESLGMPSGWEEAP
jgi:hypothetical protein